MAHAPWGDHLLDVHRRKHRVPARGEEQVCGRRAHGGHRERAIHGVDDGYPDRLAHLPLDVSLVVQPLLRLHLACTHSDLHVV